MTGFDPKGTLTLRTLAMPKDVNTAGDIFGGWVLSQMDIAGGIIAMERARGRVATVSINAMSFIAPVKVGDILCIYGEVTRMGNTSLAVDLEAYVLRGQGAERAKVTEGLFTFVALDEKGKPRAVEG
jgi:acyl-CoA thioesterase YciA